MNEPTGSPAVRKLKFFVRRFLSGNAQYRVKEGLRKCMCLSGRLRARPDFIIIGAQKSGSSSLFYYLQQHPDVLMPLNITKEVHFFDRNYAARGINWYRGHFPLSADIGIRRRLSPDRKIVTGEATPEYMVHPRASERISRDLPNARCIAVLRNPIERAYSHYKMQVKRTFEKRSFEEAIRVELDSGPLPLQDFSDFELTRHDGILNQSYLTRGVYVDQIRRWRSQFPSEQLLILLADDLFKDTKSSYRKVTDFIGIRPFEGAALQNINKGGYRDSMSAEIRSRLQDFFHPFNKALSDELGRAIDWT